MRKKTPIIGLLTFIILFSSIVPTNASCIAGPSYYIETEIIDNTPATNSYSTQSTTHTITRTKVTKGKYSDGTVLWTLSVTATFTYDGTTSKCVSCSHNATAPGEYWSVKSVSSSKSGNHATANATICCKIGSNVNESKQSVTITCDKNGNVS